MFRLIHMVTLLFLGSCAIAEDGGYESKIPKIKQSFINHMASSWNEYSVTEYFSLKEDRFNYLKKSFGQGFLNTVKYVNGISLNIMEKGDAEGGYHFGVVELSYKNQKAATNALKTIDASNVKNLKGEKVFIGYRAKQCGEHVFIIYSNAVVTDEIRSYFEYFSERECDAI